MTEGKGKEFQVNYKNLRKIFELLGPAELKLEYFEDYKWLSAIYAHYIKTVIQKPFDEAYVQKYYDKTIRFVHKSTEIENLEKELPVIAFDDKYLEALEEKVKSREEKAANILFTLNRLVLVERHRNPVYESLVEKVERLLKLWKEKTKDYSLIYTKGAETLNEMNNLFSRQRSIGFSDIEYSMLLELEKRISKGEDLVTLVRDFSKELEKHMFSGWLYQTTVKKEVEREVRRFVRGIKRKYALSFDEMNNLYTKLIECVENYGNQ